MRNCLWGISAKSTGTVSFLPILRRKTNGAPLFLLIFGENPGMRECARSFPGKQTSVIKNNKLTEIRLISKSRLGVSPSTTYFS